MKRVNIIGAGISGLIAAINLAKAGKEVKVYEKNKNVGGRFHGDFQGLENWSNKEDVLEALQRMNVDINFTFSPRYEQEVYDSDSNQTFIHSDKPIYYLVRRGHFDDTLDSGLRRQAEGLGVEIIFGKCIRHPEELNGNAYVVVASGPKRAVAVARGVTFDTTMKDKSVLVLDDSVAPQGYAYLLTWNGRGTISTFMCNGKSNGSSNINSYFERTLQRFREIGDSDIQNPRRFGGIGDFSLKQSATCYGSLFTGEAAGFQDYLWGFGMRYAFTSGYLAARSLIEEVDYDKLWKREFQGMLRTSVMNRVAFERMGNNGYKKLIQKASSDVMGFLGDLYNLSLFKRFIYPFVRIINRRGLK